METIILGIGDLAASNIPGQIIRTLGLGSCVGLVFLDPKTRSVGMSHIALPDSSINPTKAKELPGYFADTAIPKLLAEMAKLGCDSAGKGLVVKLAGGANVMDPSNTFNIGKRNILTIKKILWKYGMGVIGEEVGADISRSIEVGTETGKVRISSPGTTDREI